VPLRTTKVLEERRGENLCVFIGDLSKESDGMTEKAAR
jgi:hypothetical protein